MLSDLRLSYFTDEGADTCDELIELGETIPFPSAEAERPEILLAPPHQDIAVDINNDGRFDRLDFLIQLDIAVADDFVWSAGLYDSRGIEIAYSSGSGALSGGNAEALLAFDGAAIARNGLAGPFSVRNLSVYGNQTNASFSFVGTTKPYSLEAFAGSDVGGSPLVNAGGIVDAAAFQPTVSPGGIASLFGLNLASDVSVAATIPLPTSLGGVRVLADGIAAALFFTSNTQINFQIPVEAQSAGDVDVVVERNGLSSPAQKVAIAASAPAIFVNARTSEPIAVQNNDFSLITTATPASPGDILSIFLTGIGLVNPAVGTGEAPSGLSRARLPIAVTIGGVEAELFFAGLAPGFVGLGQVVIRVPDVVPFLTQGPTNTAGLVIQVGDASSPVVPLPLTAPAGPGALDGVSLRLNQLAPSFILPGESLSVDVSVLNPSGVLGEFERSFVVSTDASISLSEDRTIRSNSFELNDDPDRRFLLSGRLPEDLPPGKYFFAVVLSGAGGQVVSNIEPLEFLLARPPYDLNVDVEFVDPTSAAPGDRVRVFTTIQASGSLTQWLSYSIRLSTDAVLSDDDRVARSSRSLVFGGSRKVTFRPTIPDDLVAGRYFIGVMFTTEGDLNPQDNVSNSVEINISE